MSEHSSHFEVKQGSERSFGVVFTVVFAVFGLWPLLSGGSPRIVLLSLGAVFLVLAFLAPRVLEVPNRLWFKLGMLLGAIVAPIVMALVYFIAVVPMGLWVRARGKDLLNIKLDKSAKSYWIERTDRMQSMKNQF